MTTKPSRAAIAPASEREIGGLTELERQLIYARCGFTQNQITNLETMVLGSGMRTVGAGALQNVRVQLFSKKNRSTRVVESHTCERLFAYVLEMDPAVVGYYAQVPCRRILRVRDDGKQHVSQATLDFLVFYSDAVKLFECKYEQWVQREADRSPDWQRTDTGWTCTPYRDWAVANGLNFDVWTPPRPLGTYLRNVEAMYAMHGVSLNPAERQASVRAKALVATAPHTVSELCDAVDCFRERIALWLLAQSEVFGLVRSTSVAMSDRFMLYAHADQAAAADAVTLAQIADGFAQPIIEDPLVNASAVAYRVGSARLARLQEIAAGKQPGTRRMSALANHVRKAVEQGQSPLGACIPGYVRSGNRRPRLTEAQREAIDLVIRTHWNRAKVRSVRALWFVLEDECERRGVPCPSMTALQRAVKQEDPGRRALAHGGMREYQSVQATSDPRDRSMQALAYGHTLHIDSSKFDNRCAPEEELNFAAEPPTFYVAVDEATSMVMSHSLIFGSARTDGLAILMREFVSRHGFLPAIIFADRGSENKSNWLETFCADNGITLEHSPTGASRFNSLAESCIKHVNHSIAHDFAGSTEPDMAGRKVDGKYKSRQNARTRFTDLVEALKEYIYGDLPRKPLKDGDTPAEKKEESLARHGILGRLCKFDDAMMIQTAVPIDYMGKATEKKGIWVVGALFTSTELKIYLRTHQPDQVRRDCVDPSVLYVHIGGVWLKAFNNLVQSVALLSDDEKLFEMQKQPTVDRTVRAKKRDLDRERSRRHRAIAARPAHPHLAPNLTPEAAPARSEEPSDQFCVSDWDSLSPLPEE
jgi:putative transposase